MHRRPLTTNTDPAQNVARAEVEKPYVNNMYVVSIIRKALNTFQVPSSCSWRCPLLTPVLLARTCEGISGGQMEGCGSPTHLHCWRTQPSIHVLSEISEDFVGMSEIFGISEISKDGSWHARVSVNTDPLHCVQRTARSRMLRERADLSHLSLRELPAPRSCPSTLC